MDENLADRFFAAGITSAAALAQAEAGKLAEIGRIEPEQAETMKELAATVEVPMSEAEALFAPPDGQDEQGGAAEIEAGSGESPEINGAGTGESAEMTGPGGDESAGQETAADAGESAGAPDEDDRESGAGDDGA